MPKIQIQNSRGVKAIKKCITNQWGFTGSLDYVYLMNSKGKIYIVTRDFARVANDAIRIDTIGMYFGELRNDELRLSIEGSQLIGPQATQNVYDMSADERTLWVKGNDIDTQRTEHEFLIMRYKHDYLGCGRVVKGKILNFIPKSRRLREINPTD